PPGSRLAVTSDIRLDAPRGSGAALLARVGTYHELAPDPPAGLGPGERWQVALAIGHRPSHANDGPVSAFVVLADDSTVPVDLEPAPVATGVRTSAGSPGSLVPHPHVLTVADGAPGTGRFALAADVPPRAVTAWSAAA